MIKTIILSLNLILLSIFFLCCRKVDDNGKPESYRSDIRETKTKSHRQFEPHELFFLDRNYPDFTVPRDLFQKRLAEVIKYDESHLKRRDLNYPWKIQGPGNIGGRINTIAVDPFKPERILLGYSQGGIYRTADDGLNWQAVFDDQPSLAISHISFHPKIEGRIYAVTGDVNLTGYPFIGSGIFRSDDGGGTWVSVGLENHGVLSKIFADPFHNDTLYVGSMGFPSHRGDEKGFFRSLDGGETWEKTLTINDSTGIIDMAIDPGLPGRIYASSWTRLRTNTYSTTEGPGTSVFRSDDYGETWIELGNGLPGEIHSRTGVEVTNDGTVFVSYVGTIQEGECAGSIESLKHIFRSDDGGMNWNKIEAIPFNELPCNALGYFGWYFEVLKVNPNNPFDLFVLGVDLFRSVDGGETWDMFSPEWWTYDVHADKHDLVFSGNDVLLATDGGAYKVNLDGSTQEWTDIENIPSTQFYRTAFNPHLPDQYFGGAQDNGTTGGNETIFNEWPRIFGGDGFEPMFDPDEPLWMYALTQYGNIWFTSDGQSFD